MNRRAIVDRFMTELAPALALDGTPEQMIRRTVDTYLGWVTRHPKLHHFLGGSRRQPTTGSRVVAGTKTAIAEHVANLLAEVLRAFGKDTDLAESMAFGLVGLVDATVNRWLSDRESTLTAAQLADFLATSIWSVIDGYLRSVDLHVDPETKVSDLLPG
jgi:AcrR family transcriptional regulator